MKTKKMIVRIIIFSLAIIVGLAMSSVFAGTIEPDDWLNPTPTPAVTPTEQPINISTPTPTAPPVGNVAEPENKEGPPPNHPQTGLDNSIVFIIAICGISALYAYKKIKDYNIK